MWLYIRVLLIAWALILLIQLAACVVVEGACRITSAGVICEKGGKVMVLAPAHSIEAATGAGADKIADAIAADPKKVDPRLLTPPRQRR